MIRGNNLRQINKATTSVAPLVASMADIIASIQAGAHFYSVIDISNCFFAISLAERNHPRFIFLFGNNQYCFTCLVQGFYNFPVIAHVHATQM